MIFQDNAATVQGFGTKGNSHVILSFSSDDDLGDRRGMEAHVNRRENGNYASIVTVGTGQVEHAQWNGVNHVQHAKPQIAHLGDYPPAKTNDMRRTRTGKPPKATDIQFLAYQPNAPAPPPPRDSHRCQPPTYSPFKSQTHNPCPQYSSASGFRVNAHPTRVYFSSTKIS